MNEVQEMVYADPEAFGLDAPDAPRLGCATTHELLTELIVRCQMDGREMIPGSGLLNEHGLIEADAEARILTRIRGRMDVKRLGYRTIDS